MKNNSNMVRARMEKKAMASLLLSLAMLLPLILVGCGGASASESIPDGFYDRAVSLIEASAEVNQLLFGAGVPVYAYGSPEAEWRGIYGEQSADQVVYLLVAEESPYYVTSQIREAAEAVYSAAYLDTILSMLLDGYAYDAAVGGTGVLIADYTDSARGLCMAASRFSRSLERRLYDYSTIELLPPVTGNRIAIRVETYLASSPDTRLSVKLVFVKENDVWLLDSPTY